MLRMVSLLFIALPEIVKHILIACGVGRHLNIDVKISNVVSSDTRVVFCGGCRCDVDPHSSPIPKQVFVLKITMIMCVSWWE